MTTNVLGSGTLLDQLERFAETVSLVEMVVLFDGASVSLGRLAASVVFLGGVHWVSGCQASQVKHSFGARGVANVLFGQGVQKVIVLVDTRRSLIVVVALWVESL